MSQAPEIIRMPRGILWLFRIGCPVLGFGLGFAVQPATRGLTDWLRATVDSTPAPLRLVAQIPTPWAVAILTVIGVLVGLWLSYEAEQDSPTLTVQDDGLTIDYHDAERYIQRSQIGSVFTDPKELVVLAADGRELCRNPAGDLPVKHLTAAFERHGYPWRGTHDPHEDQYHQWIDGHPDLDEPTHALLRKRRTALRSHEDAEAAQIHATLQDNGIAVRDRNNRQQYRQFP